MMIMIIDTSHWKVDNKIILLSLSLSLLLQSHQQNFLINIIAKYL